MDFYALIFFLIYSALKPQEWPGFDWIISFKPNQVAMLLGIIALFQRPVGLRLKDIFRVPHDTFFFLYIAWIILGAPSPYDTFKSFQVHIVTYIVAQQALRTVDRMIKFLVAWSLILMTVTLLALDGDYGLDLLGSNRLTEGFMKGRMILNISIYNNPNTLAHTLVPVIPMLFFLLFWKKSLGKFWGVLLIFPLWCIFETESKGAFLCTFAALVFTMAFGRPKWVQLGILIVTFSLGTSVLYLMPRMSELNKSTKGNEAIQGRVAALQFGLRVMKNTWTGLGPGLFVPNFVKAHNYPKAAHNAYCQNGAELGRIGLGLFLAMMYCCFRSLVSIRTSSDDEERLRRTMFVMLAAYAMSCWMVDFAYRTTFFLLLAMCSALHRHCAGINKLIDKEVNDDEAIAQLPAWQRNRAVRAQQATAQPGLQPVEAVSSMPLRWQGPASVVELHSDDVRLEDEGGPLPRVGWMRFTWVDFVANLGLLYGVERMWAYLITKM